MRVLKWALIVLVGLVVTGVLYLSFADLGWLEPRIESIVANATGRQLEIAGAFDLDILPSPAIVLEDVRFSNAEWGSEPTMATVGHVSARVGLWLLTGPVRIKELRLRDVDVLLEVNEQGRRNWVMGAASEAGAPEPSDRKGGSSPRVPVIIEFAEVRNIRVTYMVPEADTLEASIASLDIVTDENRYSVLDVQGDVDALPLRVAGRLGPVKALESGKGIAVDLRAELDTIDLEVRGTVGDLAKMTGIDLTSEVASDEVSRILEHFAVDLPLSGALRVKTVLTSVRGGTQVEVDARAGEVGATLAATLAGNTIDFEAAVPAIDTVGHLFEIKGLPARSLDVEGRLVAAPGAYDLEGITARIGEATIEIAGTVGRDSVAAVELAVKAGGPSLADLGTELPEIPFRVPLTASLSPSRLTVEVAEATWGESDLAAHLDATFGERISVTGELGSRRLDLTPFATGQDEAERVAEEGVTEQPVPEEDASKSEQRYIFVEDPLPFEKLGMIDVDLTAGIERFTLGTIELLEISTSLRAARGDLEFKSRFRGTEEGLSVSTISLTTNGESADLDLNVNARDLRANLISGEVSDSSEIPPISVTLAIKSTGSSPRAMASSANGRLLVTQGEGRMANDLLSKVSGDILARLFTALNPFAKDEETTGVDCTIVAFEIVDGKADIAGMLFQTDKVKALGDGHIDLNTEKLSIEFNTKPRSGIGVSADMFITPFVKLAGTLASPHIGVDSKGAILVGAAAATGGVALAVKGAADRATGELDRCASLLEKVGDHPPLEEE